jgi:hypothetical protein
MTMAEQRRRVVFGISGHRTAHLIDWAGRLLRPADYVQIVEVYRPIPYAATDWQLPVHGGDWRRDLVRSQVAAAADQLRRCRPDLAVTEELTGGAIDLALTEAAQIADLMLLGVPHSDRTRHMLSRLLAEVTCPVILIGAAEPEPSDGVAAVLRGGTADEAVLRAAFDQAQRERCGLLVLKRWQPPLDGSVRYAETAEQKMLDSCLAGWQEHYPGVGVAAELRYGETLPQLLSHGDRAGLLVLALPRPRAGRADFEASLDEVIAHRSHPTMLVPERLIPEPVTSERKSALAGLRPLAGRAGHR